jgi:hypothetical protein
VRGCAKGDGKSNGFQFKIQSSKLKIKRRQKSRTARGGQWRFVGEEVTWHISIDRVLGGEAIRV